MNVVFRSGRQFFSVEEMLFSAHHASYEECLGAGTHCFLMAIDVRILEGRRKEGNEGEGGREGRGGREGGREGGGGREGEEGCVEKESAIETSMHGDWVEI